MVTVFEDVWSGLSVIYTTISNETLPVYGQQWQCPGVLVVPGYGT